MKIEIVKKHCFLIIFLSIIIILESILSITLPYLSKLLLDEVIIGNHYSLLSMIILSFAVIIVLQLLLGSLISRGSAKIETDISFRLRDNIIKKCLNLKIISSSQRSNIQTVLIQDTESYATNLVNIFYTVFSNSIRVVGCLILVFYINPLLSTICVFFLCLYIIWIIFIGEKIKSLTNRIQLSKEKIIQTSDNILYNILPIRIYSLFSNSYSKYYKSIEDNANFVKKTRNYTNYISIVSAIIISIATFVPLFVGVGLIKSSNLTVGDLVAFNAYTNMLFSPITLLIGTISTIKTTRIYENRIINLLDYLKQFYVEKKGKIENGFTDNFSLKVCGGEIYGGEKLLIKDINFACHSGDVVQIVGDNGCGKTLFLQTLMRIVDFNGDIFLDDKLISNKEIEDINEDIVYVSNDLEFVEGSLSDNIFGDISINEILDLVCLTDRLLKADDINSLDMETIQKNFSSGEIQKLKIARALMKSPKVLLLDEMFSQISQGDSDVILNGILNKFPHTIVIIVEHHYRSDYVSMVYKIKDLHLVKELI
ncbi:ABC transporter transmembrane domain-containing protein [Streptococcus pseudoporcinus]|uniref:ABC transporter, ATP-binding protein n=1 Tax=Streptococcus pseudoporcinus TaxID=361101 RepID=A0A4U9XHC8_9STRE|nr:ABC transporter ATP-binding protein [Streptococcus pseudoporcinus]VTS12554.1 ABC transporter, ATP-binding protein [Streptococcus pseudoporcinus]